MKKKFDIGIALSGGGTRGFAHLGVLKALNEKGIYPDIISGTSAGAIVGALVASGKEPEKVYKILKDKKLTDYTKINFPMSGLFSLDKLKKILKEDIEVDRLEDLKMPLIVATTNLSEGKIEYFSKGPLYTIVLASSSIPVLFSPIEIDKVPYVDGGLLDNLPVKPLVRRCKKIIAVNIHPVEKAAKVDNLIKIAARTFQLSVNSNFKYVKSKSNVYIEPEGLTKYNILNTKNTEDLFDLGYEFCKKMDIDL